jgi:hypothetical protein
MFSSRMIPSFIRTHWLGQYSLPRSFWLNTILLSWFIPIAALTLLSSNTWHLPARLTSVAFVVIFVAFYPLLIWGMGGTARAGKFYREKGGRKIWASAATLATMLLLMDSVYFFLGTRGILIEHVRMAITGKYGPPASISVSDNGTQLLLTGTLQEGSAEALAVAINNAPLATVIALDSNGGLLQEATLIAKDISQHGLDTYVSRECSSACTFAFLAGRHRCIAQGARIGFHAASYVHDLSRNTFQNIATFQRDQYLKAGLAEPFVGEIMETPNSGAWYPSHKELLEARVTTPNCP